MWRLFSRRWVLPVLWIAVGIDVCLMIAKVNTSGEPIVVYVMLGLSAAAWCWYEYGEKFFDKIFYRK